MSERRTQTAGRFAGKPYQLKQSEYAVRYGKPDRTIRRWQERGLPLDDPDAMGEYLSPRGRKPESDAEFEAPSIVPPHDPYQATEDPSETSLPLALDETFFRGKGVLAAIERLQKAEQERAAAYFAAIRERANAQVLGNRFKEWIAIVEALRKLEKDAPEIRKLNDLTLDVAEAEAAWSQALQALNTALDNHSHRTAEKVRGLTDYDEIVEIIEKEVAAIRRTLVKNIRIAQTASDTAAAQAEQDGSTAEREDFDTGEESVEKSSRSRRVRSGRSKGKKQAANL